MSPAITARGQDFDLTINGNSYGFSEFQFTPNAETESATNNQTMSPLTAVTETDASITINVDGTNRKLMRAFYNQYGTPKYAKVQVRGPQGGFKFRRVIVTGGPFDVPGHGMASVEIDAHADWWQFTDGSYTAPQATRMGSIQGSPTGTPTDGIA